MVSQAESGSVSDRLQCEAETVSSLLVECQLTSSLIAVVCSGRTFALFASKRVERKQEDLAGHLSAG